jgi:glycosyltransferase involved in cell wall biosynthesis
MIHTGIPKVLILEPSGLMFGSERALLDLLPPLKGNWDITVCCPPGLFAEAAGDTGVAVRATFTPYLHQKGRLARLGAAMSFRRIIKDLNPDLIHVNQAGATRVAAFAAGPRIPMVIHTRLFEDYDYLRERGLERRACAIICVSEAMKKEALKVLGPHHLHRLYSPYDPYAMTWMAEAEASPRQKFICIGRLGKVKGQDLLLGAVAELKRQGLEVEVTFIGSAERNSGYDDELKKMSSALGVESQVRWLGFKKDVFEELHGTPALLAPSEKEPLGRVIFEAWDAGTVPIVWQGSGGAAEVVAASGGGIIFQDRTPASLARAMGAAIGLAPAERVSLVEDGRAWLAANCEPAKIAMQLSKIWEGCLK